jgi:hypothetical protein
MSQKCVVNVMLGDRVTMEATLINQKTIINRFFVLDSAMILHTNCASLPALNQIMMFLPLLGMIMSIQLN